MIGLARDIAMFRPTLEAFVRGAAGGAAAGRVRRGAGRERAAAQAPARTDRRSRLRLGQRRREVGRRGRRARSEAAGRDHRASHRRPQHHDVDEGGGKADLLRRGLRGAARASRRLHRAADRGVREERHQRHLVRACLGRLPACAADPEPAARQGRQGDARHRRGGVRVRARIQGLAFRRARRRHRALGVPRADVRHAAGARVRGGEGPLRSGRPVQSRARSCARRSSTTARTSATAPGYRGAGDDDAARLVGLSRRGRRFPGRGRDVQQQRRLPRARPAA